MRNTAADQSAPPAPTRKRQHRPAALLARLACVLAPLSVHVGAAPLAIPVYAQESVAPKWILDGAVPQGLCPEIIAAIERIRPGLRFTGDRHPRSLAFIEDAMGRGTAWAACALVDSPARRQLAVRIGVPLYPTRYRLAVASSDAAALASGVRTLGELASQRALVNTARGSGYVGEMKARGIEVDDSTGDSVTNLRKTLHGHGRYTYLNEMSMFYYIRSAGLQKQLTVLPAVFDPVMTYFWVSRRADPALAPALEAALASLRASGELGRIHARWSQPP